jgi:hypothetical protein
MTTALILIASGILIGAGIGVIWRDVKRSRRRAFVLQRDTQSAIEPEVEIVISRGEAGASLPRPVARQAISAQSTGNGLAVAILPEPAEDGADQPAQGSALSLEQQWVALKPTLTVAIGRVNAVLAPVKLAVGASEEPAWRYKNAAYGAPRRVLLGAESLGWLRLELSADGRFLATLKAHKDEQAEINGSADSSASGINAARASEVLSRCLEPVARYAVRAAGGIVDGNETGEKAPNAVDGLVHAALQATNGALQHAGARLVPLRAPAWDGETSAHRMTLSVEVNGSDVGRMHIERIAQEIEVAVGVGDQRLADLGRRKRIPVAGVTIHTLAELIADCAWPTIARLGEPRPQADHSSS